MTGFATWARWLLEPWASGAAQYSLYYFVVGLVTSVGGLLPGLFTTLLGGACGYYFFVLLPSDVDPFSTRAAIQLVLYLFTSGLIVAAASWGAAHRRRALEEAETARRQAALVDLTPDAILVRTIDGEIRYWSRGAERLYGWTKEEALGRNVMKLLETEFPEPLSDIIARLEGGENWQGELQHHTKSGDKLIVRSYWHPEIVDGELEILESNMDISAQRAVERELSSVAQFPAENPYPVFRLGRDGTVLYANRPAEEFLKSKCWSAGGKAPEEIAAAALSAECWTKERHEFEVHCEDDAVFTFMSVPVPHKGYINFYGRNVTEARRAERALKESDERLSAVLDALPVGVVIVNRDGKIVRSNPVAHELWGTFPETPNWQSYEHWAGWRPDSGERIRAEDWAVSRALRQGTTTRNEVIEIEQFGTRKRLCCIHYAAPFHDADGSIAGAVAAMLDVTDRVRADEEVRANQERFRAVFEQAAVGIARVDLKTLSWMNVNPALSSMLGYSPDELRAISWPSITHEEDVAAELAELRRLARGEVDSFCIEKRFIHKQGKFVWARLTASLVRDIQGKPDYKLAIIEDISNQKRLEEELRAAVISAERAKGMADQANHAKDRFLAVLSHELRTPLAPVLAALSLIKRRDDVPDAIRKHLEVIKRNIAVEARLIDDLLDLNRIVHGKVTLERRAVDVRDLLESVAEVCKPDIDEKRLNLVMRVPDDPPSIDADPSRMQQVFWNLVKNAIKFTPESGTIEIEARPRGNVLVVEVRDTGIGIEPQSVGIIFEAFEQADERITRQFGGLGLGLAITKRLVEMHGGTIAAESEGKGKGATFRVTLPVMAVPASASERIEAQSPSGSNESKRILLVEDHVDTAQMVKALLEGSGHEVQVAGDVTTALRAVEAAPFDLLISDLGLPDKSGLELMREIRQSGKLIRGIALSGFGREEDILRSKEAGFAEHVIKPVDIEVLERAVEQVGAAHPQ